ncbi:MAG: 50S ribosomal protein L4 [Nanoarchaeota archaeon]
MKANVLDINGKKTKTIELPSCFSQPVREDIVSRVLETKKTKQPYSPSLVAGKQHSASGILIHRRHVWKSSRGKGISRIPRKIFSRRGSQFNWEGAEISSARGGRRAHPPKILSMLNKKRVNKKELCIALMSAISATAQNKKILERYSRIKSKEIVEFPIIVEQEVMSLKTKELISSLRKILGENVFELALKKKEIRSGKGKLRGRKYKTNSGLIFVTGKKEELKAGNFERKTSENLSVSDIADEGGVGRLTIYTEQAVKELGEKLK